MIKTLLPFLYGIAVLILLWRSFIIMLKGLQAEQPIGTNQKKINEIQDDRTGQVTIHPEIINPDGDITDEELLTVRFSQDVDPPKPSDNLPD